MKDLLEVLRLMLRSAAGWGVKTAADGARALELAREWRPDLILLDVAMPKLDGWQTLERLKAGAATSAIPVVVLTAWISPETEAKAREFKAERLMVKPFQEEELLGIVRGRGGPVRARGTA